MSDLGSGAFGLALWASPIFEVSNGISVWLPNLALTAGPGSWTTLQAIFIFTLIPLWLTALVFWWGYRRKNPIGSPSVLTETADSQIPSSEYTDSLSPQQLLAAVSDTIGEFAELSDIQVVCDQLLRRIVEVSGSEYGYVGRVTASNGNSPCFKPLSFTCISPKQSLSSSHSYFQTLWNAEDGLYSKVIQTQFPLISNDEQRPSDGGFPEEVAGMTSFLGIPLFTGGQLVGLIGLANRPQGYDDSLIGLMDPLWKNFAGLLKCKINMESQSALVENLEQSEIHLETLLETVVDGIVTIDDHGNVLTFNPAAERLFGYRSDETIGRNVKMLMPEPYASEHDMYLQNYVETQKANIIGIGREVQGLRKDGSTFHLHLAVSEMYVGDQRRFVGILRDITELKEALKEQEHLASIVDSSQDAIIGKDLEGNITSWNQAAEIMYQYSAEEMICRSIRTLVPASKNQEMDDIFNRLRRGEHIENLETRRLRKDGQIIDVALTISPIINENGEVTGVSTIARDITLRKRAEHALEESRKAQEELFNRYQSILDAAGEGIYGLDLNGATTFCNPAAAHMLGYSVQELVGKPQHQMIHHTKPGGKPFPREECSIYKAIKDGLVRRVDDEVFWRKDGTSFPVEYVSTPIMENGAIQGAVVTFRDIAPRKKAEQDLENARLAEEAANRAKGEFLANMSHEIRTPMNAILGYAQLMERDTSLSAGQKENIGKILTGGDHLLSLINDILDFSKIEAGRMELNPVDFDLKNFVERLSPLIQGRCREKNLTWKIQGLPEKPVLVFADETKLRQIMFNLVGNAVKFTQKGGVTLHIHSLPEHHFQFDVEDTGRGISEEGLNRIFGVFDRGTQIPDEGGTGLGLAITRNLVELMGGSISVRSQEGRGSTFSFTLKLPSSHGEVVEKAPPRKITGLVPGQSLDALVVDDVEENREVLSEILKSIGARVAVACDGAEGVDRALALKPHIVFMDIRMPGMNGVEAIRRIREKYSSSQIKIVIVTASVFEHQAKGALEAGGDGFISKPFQIHRIFQALEDHLQSKFEYQEESQDTRPEVGLDGLDLSVIQLETGLLARLKDAADLYSVTDLTRALEELKHQGEAEGQLASYLESLGKSFKMGEISKLLTQISPQSYRHE